jgi:hypothetical protein
MQERHYSEDALSARAVEEVYGLSPAERQDAHLGTCSLCSEKLQFFLTYYRGLRLEMEQADREQGPEAENVLVLTPFTKDLAVSTGPVDTPYLILAAKEMTASEDRFVEVMVYSSHEPPVVLRVIEDRNEHTVKAYILSEDPQFMKRVKLSFVDHNGNAASAVVDAHGGALINVPPGFNWKASHVGIVPDRRK